MAGGIGQDGTLIFADDQYVEKASSIENMRLFIDKADNLAYLKKFDGSIIPFPNSSSTPSSAINIRNIYINQSNTQIGNGSLLNPFSNIRNAIASIEDVVGASYNILLQPGNYQDLNPLNLPLNATVNFIAQGGDMLNTTIDFPINWTPNIFLGQNMSFSGVTLNEVLTVDATNVEEPGLLRFDNSSIILNVQNNSSVNALSIVAFNSNLVDLSITGLLFTYNCTLVDVVIVVTGSRYYSNSTNILADSTGILISGTAVLYTVSNFKNGNSPYVFGEIDAAKTPRWLTDSVSNRTYSGDVKKINLDNVAKQGEGTVLDFSEYKFYGTVDSPESGNVTSNMDKVAGSPLGVKQIIIHQSNLAPTFGPQFNKSSLSEEYLVDNLNVIECIFFDDQNISYSISNFL